jgi:hypothetical protein
MPNLEYLFIICVFYAWFQIKNESSGIHKVNKIEI